MSLEPIDPETAYDLYLTDKENELAEASLRAHKYRLGHFIDWCDEEGITNLNELTGRRLHEYRLWRRNDGDLNKVSEKTQMDTLRVFIRWLESIDGVEQDLSEKVLSPPVTPNENSRSEMLDSETATKVLTYLEKFHYASPEHVTIALMWHTMMRVGGVHALDVDDYNSEDQYIEVHHRPESETPIKNKGNGERVIALSEQVCELLDDWIAHQRPDVTDEFGRKPLLASQYGRMNKTTLREYVYQSTRPCVYTDDCPHDRDIESCEAVENNSAYSCPSSVSPHSIRRGSITHSLNNGMPDKVVSDRANVGQQVIDQHYDQRTEKEKMEQRRDYLDDL